MGFVALLYGFVAYLCFVCSFTYTIAFLGGFVVPKTVDSGAVFPLGEALAVNLALFALFAVQHSVMARKGFKRWWTRMVPPAVERSTYVLFASAVLALLLWQWRPIPTIVWQVNDPTWSVALTALSLFGWVFALASTFMINHFDLFGLRQVFLNQGAAYKHPPFMTRGFYGLVRHPIMLGFIIAFWAAPTMTMGHLVFAIATTAYILIALQLEERDLVTYIGDAYRDYKKRVPMLIPWTK